MVSAHSLKETTSRQSLYPRALRSEDRPSGGLSVSAGYLETDHRSSGSRLRNAVSWAASCFWTLVTSPGGCWLFCVRLLPFSTAFPSARFSLWLGSPRRDHRTVRESSFQNNHRKPGAIVTL